MLCHWTILVIRVVPDDWVIANVTPIFKEGKKRIQGATKPHLYPWESYRAKLLEAIVSYMMHKAAANIPYGFTKSDSGAVDKEGEWQMLYTLTLGWPLTWFPPQPLKKNREDSTV